VKLAVTGEFKLHGFGREINVWEGF
jgi:hypothetical protein